MKKSLLAIATIIVLLFTSCSSLFKNSQSNFYMLFDNSAAFQLEKPHYTEIGTYKVKTACNISVNVNDKRSNKKILKSFLDKNNEPIYNFTNLYAIPNEITLVKNTYFDYLRNVGFTPVDYIAPDYYFNINIIKFEVSYAETIGWYSDVVLSIDVTDKNNLVVYATPEVAGHCELSKDSKENRELNKTLALPELRFEVGSKAIEKAYLSALKAFDYSAMISEIESHMLKNK